MIKKIVSPPYSYTVRKSPKILDEGEICDGLTHKDSLLIEISSKLSFIKQQETILHETLHIALDEFDKMDKKFDHAFEEKLIRYLSPRLLAIIQSNPQLLKFLGGKK